MTPKHLLALLLLLPLMAIAAETGTAARDLNLLEEPRHDAKVVGKLAKDGRFEVIKRDKFWALIAVGAQQGWVLPFYLSFGEASQGNGSTVGRGLAEIVTLGAKPRDNNQVVATIGIRGISEEDLKSAKFNAEELKTLEGYSVAAPIAAGFAQAEQLAPLQVDYLPAPGSGVSP